MGDHGVLSGVSHDMAASRLQFLRLRRRRVSADALLARRHLGTRDRFPHAVCARRRALRLGWRSLARLHALGVLHRLLLTPPDRPRAACNTTRRQYRCSQRGRGYAGALVGSLTVTEVARDWRRTTS